MIRVGTVWTKGVSRRHKVKYPDLSVACPHLAVLASLGSLTVYQYYTEAVLFRASLPEYRVIHVRL